MTAPAPAPTVRLATRFDAERLARFAARTFDETYRDDNTAENMAAYLAEYFGEAKQAAELEDPDAFYLVVELADEMAGYAYLRATRPAAGVELPNPIEVGRFYVAREWHGRGVAQQLMAACIAEAHRRRAGGLWLAVWQRNRRGIAFYQKCGFITVGATEFRLGAESQEDWVMVLSLSTAAGIEP